MSVLEVVFLTVFWVWVVCAALFLRNTFLPRVALDATPVDPELPVEPVRFRATDGRRLEGWTIASDPGRPWIILCHGMGASRADLTDLAAGLHEARFNLLLFDFRGHGASAGRTTSFGCTEQQDLEGALSFLGEARDVPARPYGVYGVSMGAAVAIMVAARDERIGAVAVESPYATLSESLAHHLWRMYRLPTVPFLWFVLATYRLRFGVWPGSASPLKAVRRLDRRPLLLIQGAQDDQVPPAAVKAVFDAAREPKDLWVIEGAGHLEGFSQSPDAYLKRLTRFFEHALVGAPAGA